MLKDIHGSSNNMLLPIGGGSVLYMIHIICCNMLYKIHRIHIIYCTYDDSNNNMYDDVLEIVICDSGSL